MIRAAQAIHSFLKDPAFAKRYRIELFSKKYHEVFRKDIRAEEVLLPWLILKIIDEKISGYRRNEFNALKSNPIAFKEEKREEILRKEFLLYSDLIILHLIYKKYGDYTPGIGKKLINNQLPERVSSFFDYITAVLSFSDRLSKERNIPRFLKSIENIKLLYSEIEKEIEKDKATRKEKVLSILPNLK